MHMREIISPKCVCVCVKQLIVTIKIIEKQQGKKCNHPLSKKKVNGFLCHLPIETRRWITTYST